MKMKKQLLALLLAAVMVLSLTGCKETLKKVAQKVTGHSEEVQEEDTTRWAESTTDPLIIQGIADASAKYATATADGCLYAVFNGIWSRNTGYFTVPGGSLSLVGIQPMSGRTCTHLNGCLRNAVAGTCLPSGRAGKKCCTGGCRMVCCRGS